MIECEKCRNERIEIELEIKARLAKKHKDYWLNQRRFWIKQWKDIINKGKINLEISIENKITELDEKFGKAIKEIYGVN